MRCMPTLGVGVGFIGGDEDHERLNPSIPTVAYRILVVSQGQAGDSFLFLAFIHHSPPKFIQLSTLTFFAWRSLTDFRTCDACV